MSMYRDYDFDMTYEGERCTGYHREWRNHEVNVWNVGGVWHGDMIAYGEWGDMDFEEAGAVAYAFGIVDELPRGSQWALDWYFGGRKVEIG